MNEEYKKTGNFCDKAFERNHYYFGKLMKAQDFEIEQNYFNKKRWLINRMIHGWGVVCGLDVKPIEDELNNLIEINIEPGIAIDCHGREIQVCETRPVPLKLEEMKCGDDKKAQYTKEEKYAICLKFKECNTESFPIYSACDKKEKCQYNHIKDWYEIKIIPLPERAAGESICKKEHFCPNRYGCKDDKEKSLHQLICDRLIECHGCYDHSCVVLATLIFGPTGYKIEKYTDRKMVYNNPLLFDLISCYHGDLPRVCDINWQHNKVYSWEEFQKYVNDGLYINFNKLLQEETINTHTFQVVAITVDDSSGYRLSRLIPAEEDKIICENKDDKTTAVFKFESEWIREEVTKEMKDSKHPIYSALALGTEIEIILRGSCIFDKYGKALDGSFKGILLDKDGLVTDKNDLPSGTGTQGSDFVSWFSVEPRPPEIQTIGSKKT